MHQHPPNCSQLFPTVPNCFPETVKPNCFPFPFLKGNGNGNSSKNASCLHDCGKQFR